MKRLLITLILGIVSNSISAQLKIVEASVNKETNSVKLYLDRLIELDSLVLVTSYTSFDSISKVESFSFILKQGEIKLVDSGSKEYSFFRGKIDLPIGQNDKWTWLRTYIVNKEGIKSQEKIFRK